MKTLTNIAFLILIVTGLFTIETRQASAQTTGEQILSGILKEVLPGIANPNKTGRSVEIPTQKRHKTTERFERHQPIIILVERTPITLNKAFTVKYQLNRTGIQLDRQALQRYFRQIDGVTNAKFSYDTFSITRWLDADDQVIEEYILNILNQVFRPRAQKYFMYADNTKRVSREYRCLLYSQDCSSE